MTTFSHFDDDGASRMVDVGQKQETRRVAEASGVVRMQAETLCRVREMGFEKGNVLEVARLAGIMGVKQTSNLIPLCHPLSIEGSSVDFSFPDQNTIRILATVRTTGKTGVEMEALNAVSVTALTIYDMCKSVDKAMKIEAIQLESKTGGKSGDFEEMIHRVFSDYLRRKQSKEWKSMNPVLNPRATSTEAGMTRSTVISMGGQAPPSGDELFPSLAEPLAKVDDLLRTELKCDIPYVDDLLQYVASLRGKRMRPSLLFLTARATGRLSDSHITLAAVIEMIHIATLVHDDILDGASKRRHKVTVNQKYGNQSSVLLGDYLFTHSFYLASTLETTHACRRIGQATNRVCAGELSQVGNAGNLHLTEAEYYEIIRGKTAELCACATELGAFYAGASENVTVALGVVWHATWRCFPNRG